MIFLNLNFDIINGVLKRNKLLMNIAFNSVNQTKEIFADMPSAENSYFYINKHTKPDKFELRNIKEKVIKNKKVIIGLAVSTVVSSLISMVLLKKMKNMGITPPNPLKSIRKTIAERNDKTGRMEKLIQKAESSLTNDVENTVGLGLNGMCFYGPNSEGKEITIETFLEKMKENGYEIEKAPRIKDFPVQKVGNRINSLIEKAEKRYNLDKKRSIIFIRDVDQMALERRQYGVNAVTRTLINNMQGCSKKGYAFILEAVDIKNIDPAICRPGRMEKVILTRPMSYEGKDIWGKYLELISGLTDKNNKKILINEIKDIIKEKGININDYFCN